MRREPEFARHEWWSFWGGEQLCGTYSSLAAAKRAIYGCERHGGSEHTLYIVQRVDSWRGKPYVKPDKS
jgi:hypothetical protein